jgi:hypothetical protein
MATPPAALLFNVGKRIDADVIAASSFPSKRYTLFFGGSGASALLDGSRALRIDEAYFFGSC